MPWQECDLMSLREALVIRASAEDANMRALCREFQISPSTGYKWLDRFQEEGIAGVGDRSRRPHSSPAQTVPAVEAAVVALRQRQPTWGGRKLRQRLLDEGVEAVPSARTCTAILQRQGLIDPTESVKHRSYTRFEAVAPHALWQFDFKGDVVLPGQRVFPFQVLDDHSRFILGLQVCTDKRRLTVQAVLTALFRASGMPERILADNGPPWGTTRSVGQLTQLTAWLVRLGIAISHGRPRHPQTQGKIERAFRTLDADLLQRHQALDVDDLQATCDAWRYTYNTERPHEALGLATPASRYQPSPRRFPEQLPPVIYPPGETVRQVARPGFIFLNGRNYRVSHALVGELVAVRATEADGIMDISYLDHLACSIDLRQPKGTR